MAMGTGMKTLNLVGTRSRARDMARDSRKNPIIISAQYLGSIAKPCTRRPRQRAHEVFGQHCGALHPHARGRVWTQHTSKVSDSGVPVRFESCI